MMNNQDFRIYALVVASGDLLNLLHCMLAYCAIVDSDFFTYSRF